MSKETNAFKRFVHLGAGKFDKRWLKRHLRGVEIYAGSAYLGGAFLFCGTKQGGEFWHRVPGVWGKRGRYEAHCFVLPKGRV